MLEMLEKGRFASRAKAAGVFGCTEGTITKWLNELREDGHKIHYSRAMQKYILEKNDRKK